ncbi:Fungalysin/Thermolysin Extracellular metalloproteinase 5 [Tulasnella sp. 403]|nr:Fungalysin/Thermolysin Extracellular metalloproteinase 5 [Tulasnella sp. 403]
MHSWVVPLLVAASGVVQASSSIPTRKSLSFGPQLQHAKFSTAPPSPSFTTNLVWNNDRESAIQLAKVYMRDVLGHAEDSYRIRDDSYFDSNNRIWHVYAKQVFHDGLVEVADGDVHLNLRDGQVISYGDSFYRGPAPSDDPSLITATSIGAHDQAYYCAQLREALSAQLTSDAQVPLSAALPGYSDRLTKLYEHNCGSLHTLEPSSIPTFTEEHLGTAREAALYFIIAAHPSAKASKYLLENINDVRESIYSTFTHHLQSESMVEMLHNVPSTESPVEAFYNYIQTPCEIDGEKLCAEGQTSILNRVWKLHVEMPDNWYEAYVDVRRPWRIISAIDWTSDSSSQPDEAASKCWPNPPKDDDSLLPIPTKPDVDENGVRKTTYKIWPWGVNDPTEGKRDILKLPYDKIASPLGWHAIPSKHNPGNEDSPFSENFFPPFPLPWKHKNGGGDKADDVICNFTTTWGNNVQAQENWEGRNNWVRNYRPEGHNNLTFVFPYGAGKKHDGETVDPHSYIDLTITQLFYTTNMVHDLYYRYGFDEVSGNFQNYNFGRGGREDDAVIANAQDGSGYNNANFATPPDGSRGKMRMYIWNTATPYRDGDLEAGIVIHELSHGLSTRLTGGPLNSGCLGWGESGGMGEGWGDFLATTIRSTANYSDFAMGAWAANREKGIRNYKYSTNMTVNPSTYKTLDGPGYWGVHAIGEVWAQILYVVLQRLVEKYGFSPDAKLKGGTPWGGGIRFDDFEPPVECGGKKKPEPGDGDDGF